MGCVTTISSTLILKIELSMYMLGVSHPMLAIPAPGNRECCLGVGPDALDVHQSHPIHVLLVIILKNGSVMEVGSHWGLAGIC